MRLGLVAASCALVLSLAWCPAAVAHGGGAPGFASTVTAVSPATPGVTVTVRDGDDRLRLENGTGRELVVLGYDGEPYLRFAGDGVYRNTRSPATYLNDDRYAQVELPASADSDGEPAWEKVADGQAYEWHDHRIHWMSPEPPPQVRAAPDRPHHVFDWRVKAVLDGEPLVIAGSLDYSPPGGGSIVPYLAAPVAAVVLAGGLLLWVRIRRRERGRH